MPNYGATKMTGAGSNQYLTVPTDTRAFFGERPPQESYTTKDPEANPPSSIQLLVPETRTITSES
ncbi:hypothetical protein V5O48_012289 [Marasmius crinis-equi]|uniref:Uncharacterized protein n=1 Tax=Marasmius crinis-equi TaxID=585013 RepID=A0ABR3F389_9AGAR